MNLELKMRERSISEPLKFAENQRIEFFYTTPLSLIEMCPSDSGSWSSPTNRHYSTGLRQTGRLSDKFTCISDRLDGCQKDSTPCRTSLPAGGLHTFGRFHEAVVEKKCPPRESSLSDPLFAVSLAAACAKRSGFRSIWHPPCIVHRTSRGTERPGA